MSTLGVDTTRAVIPVGEVVSGGPPPQGIPALGFRDTGGVGLRASPAPRYESPGEAAAWLGGEEPVVLLESGGRARAYPLQILTWHEIVNDTLGGVPVAVTFCPLCNTAYVFDRRLPVPDTLRGAVGALRPAPEIVVATEEFRAAWAEQTLREAPGEAIRATFGTSGMLYLSNLVMFDPPTRTLWSQGMGRGVAGTLAGVPLLRYPAQVVSFRLFREMHPGGSVLSRETGFNRPYGRNPYVGYDRADEPPFLFHDSLDSRLSPKERVVTVELGGEAVAYPFDLLRARRVVEDTVGGVPVVIFWSPGVRSALDREEIREGRDVGMVGVFRRTPGERTLHFTADGDGFTDSATGSRWTILGEAREGALEGRRLVPVVHDRTLWFAWAAFRPDTRIYGR